MIWAGPEAVQYVGEWEPVLLVSLVLGLKHYRSKRCTQWKL